MVVDTTKPFSNHLDLTPLPAAIGSSEAQPTRTVCACRRALHKHSKAWPLLARIVHVSSSKFEALKPVKLQSPSHQSDG